MVLPRRLPAPVEALHATLWRLANCCWAGSLLAGQQLANTLVNILWLRFMLRAPGRLNKLINGLLAVALHAATPAHRTCVRHSCWAPVSRSQEHQHSYSACTTLQGTAHCRVPCWCCATKMCLVGERLIPRLRRRVVALWGKGGLTNRLCVQVIEPPDLFLSPKKRLVVVAIVQCVFPPP